MLNPIEKFKGSIRYTWIGIGITDMKSTILVKDWVQKDENIAGFATCFSNL